MRAIQSKCVTTHQKHFLTINVGIHCAQILGRYVTAADIQLYSKYEESISPKIKVQFDQQLFQDFVVDLYIWKLNARIIKLHYITMNVSRLRAQEINCFSHKSSFRTIYQTENSI
ncbi:Hypothetical_protein [Hexamita inflata]|uniref:Hypothetical_protein n=1 Tax=Hexamita inflata TaxID=28002 RepID=A0AA86PMT9_9EUKA|nr:Hypothetical protein HINF_LOCUS29128 [Hexamita inflata]